MTAKRKLIVMRHAKAAWPPELADHARPLAARGRVSAPAMARWLGGAMALPDLVIVSDARRTRETCALVQEVLPGLAVAFDRRLYNANLDDLLEVLNEQGTLQTLMLIAHNPGIHDLCETLADPRRGDAAALNRLRQRFPTAAIAEIGIGCDWRALHAGCGELTRFTTPAMIGGVDED